MQPYVPTTAPHQDYLIVHAARSADRREGLKVLQRKLPVEAPPYQGEASDSSGSLMFMHASDGSSGALVSGFGQKGGRFFFGPKQGLTAHQKGTFEPESPDLLAMPVGHYNHVTWRKQSVSITADPFGMEPVFHGTFGRWSVVSNSVHLMLIAAAALHPLKVRRSVLNAMVIGEGAFFQQAFSHDLPIHGASILPVDKRIVIGKSLEVRAYPSVTNALTAAACSEIPALMRQGAAAVEENIKAAYANFPNVILDVSGGKDTRAILAALTAMGGDYLARSEARVLDSGSDDLPIACGLVDLLGLRFLDRANGPLWFRTPAQCTAHWRSRNMGLNFRAGGGATTHAGTEAKTIRIAGGVAECYRSFWRDIFARKYDAEGIPLDGLVDRIGSKSLSCKSRGRPMWHAVHNALANLPAEDATGKLDLHYMFFRNRFHFGNAHYAVYSEPPVWHPLMSLHLMKAARSLPEDDRRNYGVIFRLTEHFSEFLSRVEYDGALFRSEESVEINKDTTAWKEAQARMKKAMPPFEGPCDLPAANVSKASFQEQAKAEADLALDRLRPHPDIGREIMSSKNARFMFARATTWHDVEELALVSTSREVKGSLFSL